VRGCAAALLLIVAPALFAAVERTVTPGAAGPNRLDVDVALLSQASADLHDLRIVDEGQREIGYLLVEPATGKPQWIDGRMLPIASTKKTSGFEVDLGRSIDVDRLALDGIAAPFLKPVRLEGSGDRGHWTLLASATVFDLPDDRLRLLEMAFPAGAFRYLRVTWDDSASARITHVGSARARVHGSAAAPERLRAAVPFRKRPSEPGKSRYRVDLPGPHLPLELIELRVTDGNVFRQATITEPRLGNGEVLPTTLGSGMVRRSERWGAIAESMGIAIEHPNGRELDLVVDDGSNAPLALLEIVAWFGTQPWIYFESPNATPLTARYGNPQLKAPRYDIEASRRFLENATPAMARWGKAAATTVAETKEGSDPAASLQGAAVDRGAFRVARPLPDAPAGLTVLLLDADVLARNCQVEDVRIVDAGDRQVPFVVEKRDEPLVLPVALNAVDGARGTSVYRMKMPSATLPCGTRLVLRTSARVFERTITLRRAADERRSREQKTIASETWRAVDPELPSPALTFVDLSNAGYELEVVVEEGDNATLPITRAELLLPSIALRFHHPGTPLFLLYGNDKATQPRYDLALLAPRLFAQRARELTLTPIASTSNEPQEPGARKFFWIVIILAAVALLAILGRMLGTRSVNASD
jgi:Protein of unknown function (DUF3999)